MTHPLPARRTKRALCTVSAGHRIVEEERQALQVRCRQCGGSRDPQAGRCLLRTEECLSRSDVHLHRWWLRWSENSMSPQLTVTSEL